MGNEALMTGRGRSAKFTNVSFFVGSGGSRARNHLAKAASRLDSLLGGYDWATLEKQKGLADNANPL